jgi:hypothetical protein
MTEKCIWGKNMKKGRKKRKRGKKKKRKVKRKKRGRIKLFSFPGQCQGHQFDSVCRGV